MTSVQHSGQPVDPRSAQTAKHASAESVEPPPHQPTRVIIFGASGGTGALLVRHCVDAGHLTTAFVHRRPVEEGAEARGVLTRTGDVRNRADVEAAIAGQDAVLVALGSMPGSRSRVLSQGTANIVRAMETLSVQRLVVETGANLVEDRSLLPRAWRILASVPPMRGMFQDKARQESAVKASALEWVLVRPVTLTDGPASGACRAVVDQAIPGGSTVARADVAAFMVDQLTSDTWLRRGPVVLGGEPA